MRRLARFLCASCALALPVACDDAAAPRILDLEGPRGEVVAPGPWRVDVLVESGTPRLRAGTGEGTLAEVPLDDLGEGRFTGQLSSAPVGATLRYEATLGVERAPLDGPRRVRVVARARPPDAAPPPTTCALVFRRPRDGQSLSREDDARPEAGLQINAVLRTNLADGAPASLLVVHEGPDTRYSGVAVGGEVAFAGVGLEGAARLRAEATPAGGRPCRAEIEVSAAPAESTP